MTAPRENHDRLRFLAEGCTQCAACLGWCEVLDGPGLLPGEIAGRVLDGDVDDRLVAAVQRCSLCDLCTVDCPVDQPVSALMKAARGVLIESGLIPLETYDHLRVDRDWHFFTLFRATHGVDYAGLGPDRHETVFFPGCTVSSYTPELTAAAHAWLQERLGPVGLSAECCGKPLESLGLTADGDAHLARLRARFERAGVRRIVVACPNCRNLFTERLAGFEIVTIYSVLADAGVRLSGPETLTVHDSCPDRFFPETPHLVRELLGGHELVEMPSSGERAICCGSGGLVSSVDPAVCEARARVRVDEFAASGAAECVTTCMSCSLHLSRAAGGSVHHCLEKVFGVEVDYDALTDRIHAVWAGEQGELNAQRLAEARVVPEPATEGAADA